MNVLRTGAMSAGLCAVILAAACAGAPRAEAPPAATRADSLAELESLFRERLAADRARYTEADVRFMTDMIAHHAQAVLMANLVPGRDAGPAIRTLAARIRTGQLDEIAIMQQWLRERGRPVPEVHVEPGAAAGHGHHAHHDVAMPGMLTAAQFAQLEAARGVDFDRLFLVFMIEHHRGALVMVDALLAADGAAQDAVVFRLASDIHVEQTAEIGRMQRMLAELLGRRGSQ